MICTAEPPCLEDGEVMGWETYAELLKLRDRRKGSYNLGPRSAWERRTCFKDLQYRDYRDLVQEIQQVFHIDPTRKENPIEVSPD